MNTPNKLTLLRFFMVPFFVFFVLSNGMKYNYMYANIIFILASLTDALDGYLARKYNLITSFGKFMDPLADKVLVAGALICFIEINLASSIAVLIIITREFVVSGLRLVAVTSNIVIPANIFGKIKTVLQMVFIIFILLLAQIDKSGIIDVDIENISNILVWVLAFVTAISGITYVVDNRKCIDTTK